MYQCQRPFPVLAAFAVGVLFVQPASTARTSAVLEKDEVDSVLELVTLETNGHSRLSLGAASMESTNRTALTLIRTDMLRVRITGLEVLSAVAAAISILGAITGFNSWVAGQVRITKLFGDVDKAGQEFLELLRKQLLLCEQLPRDQSAECSAHFHDMGPAVKNLQDNAAALEISASGKDSCKDSPYVCFGLAECNGEDCCKCGGGKNEKRPWYKKAGRWLWRFFRRSATSDDVEKRLNNILDSFNSLTGNLIALQGIQQQIQLQGLAAAMNDMRRDVLLATETMETNLAEKIDDCKQQMKDYFDDVKSMLEPLFEDSARAKWRAWAGTVKTAHDTDGTCAAFFSDPHKSDNLNGWLEGDLNGDVIRLEEMVNMNIYQSIDDVEKKVRILVNGHAFAAKDHLLARLQDYSAYCNPKYDNTVEIFGIEYEAPAGHNCAMPEFQIDEHQVLSVLPRLSKYKEMKAETQCAGGDDDCDLTKQLNGCNAVRKMLNLGFHMSGASTGTKDGEGVNVSAATALVADQFLQLRTVMKRFKEAKDRELLAMEKKAEEEAAKQAELQQKDTSVKTYEETEAACRELDYCNRGDGSVGLYQGADGISQWRTHHGDCTWEETDDTWHLAHTGKWLMQCKCADFWEGSKCEVPTPKRHCSVTKYNQCTAHPIAWFQQDCKYEHGWNFKQVDWEPCGGGFGGRYICRWDYMCQSPNREESYEECCQRV